MRSHHTQSTWTVHDKICTYSAWTTSAEVYMAFIGECCLSFIPDITGPMSSKKFPVLTRYTIEYYLKSHGGLHSIFFAKCVRSLDVPLG